MTVASRSGAMQSYALTLNRFIEHAAKWHGATEVVTGGSGGVSARIRYSALRDRSKRLSGALLSLGLEQGDNLGVMAWNSQAHLECWYGAMGVGIVCHTLNPRVSPMHLAQMIQQAANRVLVVSPDLTLLVEKLLPVCPTLEQVVILEEPGVEVSPPSWSRVRIWRYNELLEERGLDAPWGGFDENIAAGLCFTSGTTGVPKGITYTHRSNYLHTIHQLQADVSGLTGRDSVLVAVPMFHANGWGFPFAAPAVGAKLVLPGRHQDGLSLANLINTEGVTAAVGVATVWLGLVDHLDKTGAEVPSLRRIMLGGSSVPQALMDRLENRLGVTVQTSWGMTELSPIGTVTPVTATVRKSSQAGRPPIGIDLTVVDADGMQLPRGCEGRLQVRGASVVERYFGHDSPAVDKDGWFDTGDLAVIDGAGNLSITGRAKDLIKSGGEWINPGEIEAIVGALPEVALVAVVGRAHAKWGERPILIVEARKGAHISDEALLDALRTQVAKWWLPDAIVRVAAMPLATTGKIDKRRLRAEYGGAEDWRGEMTGVLKGLFDLTGRVALVTGGSRGLGLQIAGALGEFGASLALVARKKADLDEAVEQLNKAGCAAVGFVADLGTSEAAAGLTERVIERYGRIDILVNNAGATWGAPAEDYPLDGWNKVIDLNVTGLFLLTQAVARSAFLKQGKGTVVNVASVEGLLGHLPERPGTVAYNAAKGAVISMTRALAAEWGGRNIRVNALAPGYFPSKMTRAILEKHADGILRQTPLGKLGGDTDLMGPALLLASDAGGHITGQTLVIDGGASII